MTFVSKQDIENLKKTIKVFEKAIKILKKSNTPDAIREGFKKFKPLFDERPRLYKYIENLKFEHIQYQYINFADIQPNGLREICLVHFPKEIEACKKAIEQLKPRVFRVVNLSKIPKKAVAIVSVIVIVVLVVIFFPRPPPVLEVKITPGASLYSFQWSGSQWTGTSVNYTIEIKNNGNEDLDEVSLIDSAGFDWTGALEAGESKEFVIIYIGELEDDLAITANTKGSNSAGAVFTHSAQTSIDIFGGTYGLQFAIDEDFLTWELSGKGACSGSSIGFSAKLKIKLSIDIELDAPLILDNSGSGQNMIVIDQRTLSLIPDIDYDFDLKAYCLDLHKSNPSSSEIFAILSDPSVYGEDIITLVKYLNTLDSSERDMISMQLAVWVLTDNIYESGIPFSYSQSNIDEAKAYLEGAGISISGKSLFQ